MTSCTLNKITNSSATIAFLVGTDGMQRGVGLARIFYRLGVPDKVIQAILRHSSVNVTLRYYIKPQSEDVVAAMGRFEAEMAAHNLRDNNGTVPRAQRPNL